MKVSPIESAGSARPRRPKKGKMTASDWENWCATTPDLLSPRIESLSSRGLLDPQSLTPPEIRELAASIIAHVSRLARSLNAEQQVSSSGS